MIRIVVFFIFLISCTSSQSVVNVVPEVNPTVFAKTNEFALSPPLVGVDSMIFSTSASLSFLPPSEGAYVTYAVNEEPTKNSKEVDGIVKITESGIVYARAFHPDHLPSDVISVELKKIEDAVAIQNIATTPLPNERYSSGGMKILHDRKRGGLSFGNGDWLGFNEDEIEIEVDIADSDISKISVGVLQSHGAWIFLPKSISVIIDDVEMGMVEIDPTKETDDSEVAFYEVVLKKNVQASSCKVLVKAHSGIPEWHPGKGTTPWTFIDEIIIE